MSGEGPGAPDSASAPWTPAGASAPAASGSAPRAAGHGRKGLAVFLFGVACEGLGFVLLDHGSMDLAPALLVGSFGVMALGIWVGW